MATRIDIEITSDRGDGTLTWRAAGAKQPKGTVAAGLLPSGAGVGDVLKAEAEFTVDGPELISLAQPKAAKADTTQRLELINSAPASGGVTTELARKGRGQGRDGRRGPRRNDRGRGSGPRGDRDGGRERARGRGPRQPQIRLSRTHREAWIATLPEHRRPVAEQLMHEGLDGVRSALERQNRAAVDAGGDAIDIAPIMRIADELAPQLETAEVLDRADALLGAVDNADLRELRKEFIGGADRFPPDTTATIRAKLTARIDRDQATWARELREALAEGRIVRALQRSGRPPKAGVPLPADLVEQLCAGATEALDPDEEPHRWNTVVDALANSPVRRLVEPTEVPEEQDDELLDTIDRVSHLVPGVARAFGIEPRPPRRNKGR